MKVRELVKRLFQLDPEMDVLMYSEEDDCFKPLPDPQIYNMNSTTRDFSAVTPKGTTTRFLVI